MTSGPTDRGRVRLGIVGLGVVAQAVHLPLLERLRNEYAISALCDLSPSLLAGLGERTGVPPDRRFTDVEEMLSAELDAVAVLASGSHGAVTLAALRTGLPVFVEKPLAVTLEEADRIAAAPGSERVLVGYMKLWDPAVRRAMDALETARASGASVRMIEVTVLHPTSERQLWQARLLPPATDIPPSSKDAAAQESTRLLGTALGPAADAAGPLYADVLLGSVVHELALVRAFDGDPVSIDRVDVWPPEQWPPSVAISGRLAGGGRLHVGWHFLPSYAAYRELVRVVLDDMTLELEFPSPYLLHAPTRLTITEPAGEARRDVVTTSVTEAFEEELLAFHALVTQGTRPLAGVANGRADIVTCQRIVRRFAVDHGLPIGGEAAWSEGPA